MDDKRVFGYCAECESEVVDDGNEYYVNEDGEVFCSIECVLEHYHITTIEV